jgi:hypothetical protein
MAEALKMSGQVKPIKSLGYKACQQWLENGLWHDILPPQDPLPSGAQAAEVFLVSGLGLNKAEFAREWEQCLREFGLRPSEAPRKRSEHAPGQR